MPHEYPSSYLSRFRQKALEGHRSNEQITIEKRQQSNATKLTEDNGLQQSAHTLQQTNQEIEARDNNDNDQQRVSNAQREGNDEIHVNEQVQGHDNIRPARNSRKTSNVIEKIVKNAAIQRNQMKVTYHQFGANPLNVIHVEKDDGIPSPEGPDQVVVKILASTVSIQDCLDRRGFDFNILHPTTVPRIPGCDMVGQIIVTGSKVFDFVEGDRVGAFLPRGGGNARYICLKADRLIPIPSDIDAAEAVTMMSIYLMAYQVLKMITLSGPTFTLHDKKVLIILGHGRTDPIGHALIQMCQKARAFILVTAPKSQHEYYKTVWNVVPLPVDSKEWIQMVQYRMDYVFDGLCEDGLKTPYRALKRKNPTCELVCYGCTSMLQQSESMGLLGAPLRAHFHRLRINLLSSMTSSSSNPVKRVQFVDIYDDNYLKDGMYKKHIRSLLQLLKLNKIKPKVIEKVPLSKVAEAQLLIEASWTPSVTENEESNIVGSSNDGNQKLKEIEESLKHHGIIVCLPWMKDKKSTKRGYDKGTNTSESDVHETGRPATPELVNDKNAIEVCDKFDDATNNDKRNDKSEEDKANDGTVHPIEDYSRTLNEDTGIAIETIGGEATVVTDASSIQTQFWLMCLDV